MLSEEAADALIARHAAAARAVVPAAEVIAFDAVIHDNPDRDNPCFCGQDTCPDSGPLA